MNDPIEVQIVGAPVACAQGTTDTWRSVAGWAASQLEARFGDAVRVRYFDLFEADCPPLPPDAQLPLVLVNGEVLSSGGKIRIPLLRRRIETLLQSGTGNDTQTPAL
ncbi:MAG: hypothetical protein Fur0018_08600 [Anaerolineales bacterium]